MKKTVSLVLAAALALVAAGCLVTGQITIFQKVDEVATTNLVVTPILVNLNEEEDYVEHKDDIKSVDEISVVAVIRNNLSTPADVEIYLSDEAGLTLDEVLDPARATLVFVAPTVPGKTGLSGSGVLKIGWADGFRYIVDKKALTEQILGDGKFMLYAVAEDQFDLRIKAEIAVTLTVGK